MQTRRHLLEFILRCRGAIGDHRESFGSGAGNDQDRILGAVERPIRHKRQSNGCRPEAIH